ncbi:MAG: T9SS type A sorting domain-containing protein [Flavobacterium sp.]|nr:T9SS type A sorting domain-containing protein [Flavobacterium sp.]
MQKLVAFVVLLIGCSVTAQNLTTDNAFGQNGHTITSIKNRQASIASLGLQSNKKIIACGSAFDGSSNQLVLTRYSTDGLLDKSFGTAGRVVLPIGTYMQYESNSVHILKNNSILVAATDGAKSDQHIVLLKFHPNGSQDRNFGKNGIARVNLPQKSVASSIAVQSDGKIIVGGKISEEYSLDYTDFLVGRFLPNGSPDESFGVNGFTMINFGTTTNRHVVSEDVVHSLKIQPDGKIIAAGFTFAEPSNSTSDFAMLRLNFDGSPDTTFGKNGRVITNFGRGEIAESIQLADDGKILLSGIYYYNDDASQKICLAKYNSDGTLDTNFGINGKVVNDFNNDANSGFAFASHLQPDGKLIVGGYVDNTSVDLFLQRFNADGTPDVSFGFDGQLTIDRGADETANVIFPLADGSLLLGGGSRRGSKRDFLLTKVKTHLKSNFKFGADSFSVSPNPFKKYIDVEFNMIQNEPIVIEVRDALGNNVTSVVPEKIGGKGGVSERINFPDTLSAGMYYLNISAGDRVSTVRIQKHD